MYVFVMQGLGLYTVGVARDKDPADIPSSQTFSTHVQPVSEAI